MTFKNQHKNHFGLYHHRPETSFVLTMIQRKSVGKLSLESYAHLNISHFFSLSFFLKLISRLRKDDGLSKQVKSSKDFLECLGTQEV